MEESLHLMSFYNSDRSIIWLATISFSPSASPHVTGIIDQIPSEELRRGLMLLSKVASKFF